MKKIKGEGVKFERIRRITGYLVGTTDRFNNAKRAEESQRVKHNTDKQRGCEAVNCDKWADKLPAGIKEEDEVAEGNNDEDISDSAYSA